MSINNLWDDLEVSTITLPQHILEEAIKPFNEKTKGMGKNLYFRLRVEKYGTNDRITQTLHLCAPDLGGYAKLILTIAYEVFNIYPCVISNSLNIMDEGSITCRDEEEFENKIISILSSPDLKDIISKLLAQCPLVPNFAVF